MKNIAFIPARGGSKRLPGKNLRLLAGIPLICHTIRAAKAAGIFDLIVLSSDDDAILETAAQEGVHTDKRPQHLAQDETSNEAVVLEFLQRTGAAQEYATVTSLLPTCPFRTPEHVRAAFEKFSQYENECLIGVTPYDFPVTLALKREGDFGSELMAGGYEVIRSQDTPVYYHPNGAMYISTIENYLKTGTYFQPKMLMYEMDAVHSFDIDYPYQFTIAEVLAEKLASDEHLL